jgi:CRP-like cAMP-binding protein
MNVEVLQKALRDSGFLTDAPEEHLVRLAEIAKPVEFESGQVIFREGDVAVDVYIILAGSVSLEICAPGVGCRRIVTLDGGDLLGWSPLLEQMRLTATARAITPTKAVALSGHQVLALCEHDPKLGYDFMRRAALAMGRRLTATRMQLLDVFGTQMQEVKEPNPT